MKATLRQPIRTCPACGTEYRAVPAVSRKDNHTEICPDCGIREALEALGMSPTERETVLGYIKAQYRNERSRDDG